MVRSTLQMYRPFHAQRQLHNGAADADADVTTHVGAHLYHLNVHNPIFVSELYDKMAPILSWQI